MTRWAARTLAQAKRRRHAAYALGKLGPRAKAAIPALIRHLGDKDAFAQAQCAWALGEIGPIARSALPTLEKMLEEKRHAMVVREAIGKIRAG